LQSLTLARIILELCIREPVFLNRLLDDDMAERNADAP
jgi:hypothetical protein